MAWTGQTASQAPQLMQVSMIVNAIVSSFKGKSFYYQNAALSTSELRGQRFHVPRTMFRNDKRQMAHG